MDTSLQELYDDALGTVQRLLNENESLRQQLAEQTSGEAVDTCTCPDHGTWIEASGYYINVRQLDVALNGEHGAAERPLLIDILSQVEGIARKHGKPVLECINPSVEVLLEALRKLAEGEVRITHKIDKCVHGQYGYEHCEMCYQDFAQDALNAYSSKPQKHLDNTDSDSN
jgi:hypothetical protein